MKPLLTARPGLLGQSRPHSLLETTLSTLLGLTVALITQIIVFPWFDILIPFETNLTLAAIFTFVSILRGYAVRRLFNHFHIKGIL